MPKTLASCKEEIGNWNKVHEWVTTHEPEASATDGMICLGDETDRSVVSYLRCTGLAGYVNHSDRDHT